MRWSLRFTDERPRVAVLASKEPHCLHDLLNRWRTGELAVDVPVVVSNHPDHAGVAEWYGVPYAHHPIVDGDKAAQEAAVAATLADHGVDLVVLARYMQVLSPELSARRGRSGSSTSTTRSCPRSRAPARTTRPTSGA